MANFFKSYYADLNAKRQAEQAAQNAIKQQEKLRRDYINGLERGQAVKYSNLIDATTGKPANVQRLYYVDYIDDNHILLADNKKTALSGNGFIYAVCGILY